MADGTRNNLPEAATPEASGHRNSLPGQQKVWAFYNSVHIQVFVACLIGANFLTNIVEKEIDPTGVKYEDVFSVFELLYNIAFTIELAVNLYSHWWCEFWRSGWNVFDTVVVTIGLINMAKLPLPSAFSMLRMMRAFRVFRLFKRVHSLNKIIVAIVHAVPGVMNAFLILFIIMSIYGILAVEFYTHMAEDCFDEPLTDPNLIYFRTPRGRCAGPEYFGTFSRSLYSFFQVLTGESWSEWVARPAIWYYVINDDPLRAVAGALFFVSYVLITGFMLINVVVAVLLDKMSDPEITPPKPEDEEPPDQQSGDSPQQEDSGISSDSATKELAPNGVAKKNTKLNQLRDVQQKVGQLVEDRNNMRQDLDAFRSDLADLKQKLATVLKLVGNGSS